MNELSGLVLDYVREHPGCRAYEVAAALGLESNATRRRLEKLYVGKLVGRQSAMTGNLGTRWYPEAVS